MKRVTETIEKYGIASGERAEEMTAKLTTYMKGILEWNEKVNLTAIRDEHMFVEKHYIDSLSACAENEFKEAKTVLDMGTGGGFPGIPLAIVAPDKDFVLADSLEKRLKIISTLCDEIGISNVSTAHYRAEDMGQDAAHREKYDLVVARAVSELRVLLEYCLPLVKVGGNFIAYKGSDAEEEIKASANALGILGGKVERIVKAGAGTDSEDHVLVVIKKIKETPKSYPRKAGTPTKKPL